MKDGFFIGELSRKVGIPTHTIRYYEKLGLINPPERTDTHYRVYSEEDEARLRFIIQAKLFGLTLDEIKEIIDLRDQGVAPCEHLKGIVKKHLDDLDRRIQEMIWFRNELAKRYEKFNTLDSDTSPGTICGLIEQECRGAVDDTRTDER
jgi:MerR family transcriptional regulator, copper efflux regulator